MQQGLGFFAAKIAFKQAGVWSVITLGFQILIFKKGVNRSFLASIIWQSILVVFYGCLWLLPQRNLFRRPAVIYYARTWFLFRLLCILATTMFYFDSTHAAGNCLYVMGNLFPFAIFEPILLYYTLLQDSKWWQGQDIFQGRRDKDAEEIRSPLQGIDINLRSAQSLAGAMDRMGQLTSSAAASLHSPKRNTAGDSMFATNTRQLSDSHHPADFGQPQSPVVGGAVKLLNFAYISLDKNKQLGSGSFSRVYQGRYRRQPCAVKLIFTVDLTVEVIKRVAAEAQLLSLIRHPNVVDILGVAVLPPSVCILLELCSYGSLGDTLRNTTSITSAVCSFNPVIEASNEITDNSTSVTAAAMRGFVNGFNSFITYDRAVHPNDTGFSMRSDRSVSGVSTLVSASSATVQGSSASFSLANALGGGNSSGGGGGGSTAQVTLQQIQALSLNWSDRLYLAVGCARGLAALHTFSSDLCHRDIKSFNFLIDSQLNAKISDLELGMAELLNHGNTRKKKKRTSASNASVSGASVAESGVSMGNSSDLNESEHSRPSLAGTEILANWAAPEVIQGSSYTQAADVYSFALVLWEILVGRVPFSEVKRQDEIRRRVLAGTRPLIPGCFITGDNGLIFSRYVDLIVRSWDHDPTQRPSIVTILSELEDMWHCCGDQLMSTTDATLSTDEEYSKHMSSNPSDTALGAPSLLASHVAPDLPDENNNRNSQVHGVSFSRPSSTWWQSSFASPKHSSGPNTFGSASMHSGQFSSHGPGGASGIPIAQTVLDNLRLEDDGSALHALEASGACYVLVLPFAPHEVVWATHAWCLMSGCDAADIVGKPLHTLPIFDKSSFVRIKSGSQRKGTLAAELELPHSPLSDIWNAISSSLFGSEHLSTAAEDNANATSLFFKSLNCHVLHRARSVHAIMNVFDFSSRTWNMSASQRNVSTLSRRIVNAMSGRSGGNRHAAMSADSGATAPGAAGSAVIDTSAPVICSSFSVTAHPVYQRTISASPMAIPSPNPGKGQWLKSGFFKIGSLSKPSFSGSLTPQDAASSYMNLRPHTPGGTAEGEDVEVEESKSESITPPTTPIGDILGGLIKSDSKKNMSAPDLDRLNVDVSQSNKHGDSSTSSDTAATAAADAQVLRRPEHIALVRILFSRLREPPQLMVPLPTSAATAAHMNGMSTHVPSGSNRSSFRIVSTGSNKTSGSVLPRRLTGNSGTDEPALRESCIEIPMSDYSNRDSFA